MMAIPKRHAHNSLAAYALALACTGCTANKELGANVLGQEPTSVSIPISIQEELLRICATPPGQALAVAHIRPATDSAGDRWIIAKLRGDLGRCILIETADVAWGAKSNAALLAPGNSAELDLAMRVTWDDTRVRIDKLYFSTGLRLAPEKPLTLNLKTGWSTHPQLDVETGEYFFYSPQVWGNEHIIASLCDLDRGERTAVYDAWIQRNNILSPDSGGPPSTHYAPVVLLLLTIAY